MRKVEDYFDPGKQKKYEELLQGAERQAIKNWEIDFVAGLRESFDKYGSGAYLPYNQLDKLRETAER